MLGQKALPAILLLLPVTSALTVHTTVVEAASNPCKAKPASTAPAGTRWYYRANRVDHSRCWFLSSQNMSVRSRLRQTASVTRGHFIRPNAGEVPDAQQDREVGPQIASAIEPAEDRLASGQAMVPQLTTPAPDPPRSYELLARKVATIPYRLSVASTQPPSDALVQARPSGSQASAGVASVNLVFLGAAVVTSLSLAGGVFHLTRRVRSRDHALADRQNADRRLIAYPPEPVVDSLEEAKQQLCSIGQSTGRQPTGRHPTALTAHDLNRSLREVRRNLQRAGFARVA
jgi:hypothetical protein